MRRKKKIVTIDLLFKNGAVAQLGARLNGIQEVGGSIPPSSTLFYKGLLLFPELLFLLVG